MFWSRILAALESIDEGVFTMSAQLDELIAQVAANATVIGGATALIQGFAAQLAAAGTDPAKLAELAASLKASDDALAAAVVANTSVAPAGPPIVTA
jgi:hypothetical protein